ncbi:invasion associated locus B family protein [Pseudaestuariivita rosea]|uniref:invasion associated locus B family protein n=1 Tax=Pseudaestuariivita rosea TaxID=2763263 RepID=UPI001ABAA725|nr:invasion associated locus B family protein [Pseudaestuariivita rosea]
MIKLNVLKAVGVACVLALPAFGQETTNEVAPEAPAEQPVDGLQMGEEVTPGDQVGSTFIKAEFNDWVIRCVRLPQDREACELHQTLEDDSGNSVAEVNMLPLEEGQRARAVINFMAPLETLLTEGVTISIDGAAARRYQFKQCAQIGCLAQFGIDEDYINSLKAGNAARVRIVPAVAPDQEVVLNLSLSGFTAAFNEMDKIVNTEEPAPPPQ